MRGIHLYANVFPMLFRPQMCPPPNMPPCPAMCRPASKLFCLPQNCKVQRKDVDLRLALQLATNEGNHVFNRGSSRQQPHKVIHASHRSQIAAASQPHRRKTYRYLVDCSERASMQPSPDAVPEPRDSLTQIVAQNA